MFTSIEEQEQFINHLMYLLNLSEGQRCRRPEWQKLKEMLKKAGNWRRKPPVPNKERIRQMIVINNKRNRLATRVEELEEKIDEMRNQADSQVDNRYTSW